MIDIHNELFDGLYNVLITAFPALFIASEYTKAPSSFPCVTVEEIDNTVYAKTRSSRKMENHAQISYEINVYSNKKDGRKQEAREIMGTADNFMVSIGFRRSFMNPVSNLEDATIYRIVARYTGVVSDEKIVYSK